MSNDSKCDENGRVVLEKTRYSGLRKIIGNNMGESLKKAPQATITMRVDTSAVKKVKERYKANGEHVTYTDIFIKLIGAALIKHPQVNASLQDEKWIVQYANANVSVAVSTPQGLYVPVIKDVQAKRVTEISKELVEIAKNLRAGDVRPEYFIGGTFTVSNLGMYDIDVMTPIVNQPEAAILCFGAIHKEFVILDDDTSVIKPLMWLSLSLDHSVLDGSNASEFMLTIREMMENPDAYLN